MSVALLSFCFSTSRNPDLENEGSSLSKSINTNDRTTTCHIHLALATWIGFRHSGNLRRCLRRLVEFHSGGCAADVPRRPIVHSVP